MKLSDKSGNVCLIFRQFEQSYCDILWLTADMLPSAFIFTFTAESIHV